MPVYTVQIEVNVPSVGARTFTSTGIVAPNIIAAIDAAKAGVIVTPLAVQQTAATP